MPDQFPQAAPCSLRYRATRQLAQTGGSTIILADDCQQPAQQVVLKRLSRMSIPFSVVLREVQIMQLLKARCPSLAIPQVYELRSDQQWWTIVMEYLPGQTLEALLAQRRSAAFSAAEGLAVGLALTSILAVLHAATPIVHRDIKPTNILYRQGRIFLLDFGTACEALAPPDHFFCGTQGFAAPEQEGGHAITPQADIYGLGATLYRLISGKLPESSFPVLTQARVFPPPIAQLLRWMTRNDPVQRPPSMAVVHEVLTTIRASTSY